jgi:hypothetical protein
MNSVDKSKQLQTYRGFFVREPDGNLSGFVREVRDGAPFALGIVDNYFQASYALAERITLWAHGERLSRLPTPEANETEKPSHVTVMNVEVHYIPS